MDPIDHLFRRESGRMVSALTRIFGVHNLALAEDVVQDAFRRAVEVWKFRGVPENPAAWLMATAKNRAIDVLRRERTAQTHAPALARLLENERQVTSALEDLLAPDAFQDDLLRMMFTCCHPRLPETAQIAIILNILCGFGVSEIAGAFFSGQAAVEKRLWRSKKTLSESKTLFDLVGSRDLPRRLSAVHRALYLLFNEGYHGAHAECAVRADLCHEAMRLAALLGEHPLTSAPATHALSALMLFNAARLPARLDEAGELNALLDQDRARWDQAMIDGGRRLLDLSASGDEISVYHVEAAIACLHSDAKRVEDTDWPHIVSLYDMLMAIAPTPVVALNRAIAIGQRSGPEAGLAAIHAVAGADRLRSYPFYHAALGELEWRLGHGEAARAYYEAARKLARSPMERTFFRRRIEGIEKEEAPAVERSVSTRPEVCDERAAGG